MATQTEEPEVIDVEPKQESLEEIAFRKLDEKEESKEKEELEKVEEPEKKAEDTEKKEDEEGYVADEDDDEPEEVVAPEVKEEWKRLSPLERYLAEQIPPLQIKGTVDGKSSTVSVYAVENIPDDFEFGSRGEERRTLAMLDRMERKAEQLTQQFEQQQQSQSNERFVAQENRDIRSDIARLQREGEIPLGTRGVNADDDPKLQVARDVLAYYESENAKRLQESNQTGRIFNRLSYYDAYKLWKVDNKPVSKEQQAEDAERKEISRRAARGQRQGATNKDTRRLNLPRTASWDEVINAVLGS